MQVSLMATATRPTEIKLFFIDRPVLKPEQTCKDAERSVTSPDMPYCHALGPYRRLPRPWRRLVFVSSTSPGTALNTGAGGRA